MILLAVILLFLASFLLLWWAFGLGDDGVYIEDDHVDSPLYRLDLRRRR